MCSVEEVDAVVAGHNGLYSGLLRTLTLLHKSTRSGQMRGALCVRQNATNHVSRSLYY